jgi:hypothetical protein
MAYIFPEMLKIGRTVIAPILLDLFLKCLGSGLVPNSWTEAFICPVFKQKGSHADIANYRPIALSNLIHRVLERCLLSHHLFGLDNQLSDTQGGFRPRRSTMD